MVDFGLRIKNLRTQEKMTQKELSERLGVTKSVISAYEIGLRMPSYDILIQIARIFKVSTDYLLGIQPRSEDYVSLEGVSEREKQALKVLVEAMREK